MSAATAKRTKKRKPRVKAKPLKKATKRQRRLEEARRKTTLAVVASLDEILRYDGGADSPLEDPYVMGRAKSAYTSHPWEK